MKKTIFTFCSIAVVCGSIFLACSKDDNSATHVGYASQMGTGTNPDPNHTYTTTTINTTSGSTTSGTTTGSTTSTNTTTTNFSVDGTAVSNPTASGAANPFSIFQITSLDQTATDAIQILFSSASAPSTGAYTIVSSSPTGNQCQFTLTTGGSNVSTASSGVVNITAGATNTATFSGIICTGSGNHTVTGTIKY